MTLTIGNIYVIHCSWIKPPKPKICLCICDKRNWFFWFNTDRRFHGIGQLPIAANAHRQITHDCFLDLSGVKFASASEVASAADKGAINVGLRNEIKVALSSPIKRLPEAHRLHALAVL